MPGVFVTGTDTGVGKTIVSACMLNYLADQGIAAAGLKPIASGFDWVDGELQNEDVMRLTASSSIELAPEIINRYRFTPAIAPHIAAQQEQVAIGFDAINEDVAAAQRLAEFVVVEGVGGWRVPLTGAGQAHQDVANLASHLGLPVILVVGMRLGCLNHTLLTADAIRADGLTLLGWAANHLKTGFSHQDENVETLRRLIPEPLLFEVPYWDSPEQPQALINPAPEWLEFTQNLRDLIE